MKIVKCLIIASIFTGSQLPALAAGEPATVTATLDLNHARGLMSSNFVGLSFEASLLLPDKSGLRYFRPSNQPLIHLFHMLGIKSLRIGGNTSDRNAVHLPSYADWDSLFAFARVAHVKVIYTLQLYHGDPQVAVRTVKYIMDHYAPLVDAFSIGQEPSAYPAPPGNDDTVTEQIGAGVQKCSYPVYAQEWNRFANAIIAVVPDVKFCGPDVHDDPRWTREDIAEFGRSNHLALITEHLYPGGDGHKVPTPEIGCDQMLGKGFMKIYQELYEGFVPMTASAGLPYRLDEVNNFYDGGATNASDTFASALWGLDFMYWWAEHGAVGVNFHTGNQVAAGSTLQDSKYSAFTSTGNNFLVRSLGYGIKAFDVGGHGQLIPVAISNPEKLNLSIYAVQGRDQSLFVTVINKEHGLYARKANLILNLNRCRIIAAARMSLASPDNNIAAKRGQTLGGAKINANGSWNGKWTALKLHGQDNVSGSIFKMEMLPATAYIVRLSTLPVATQVSQTIKND